MKLISACGIVLYTLGKDGDRDCLILILVSIRFLIITTIDLFSIIGSCCWQIGANLVHSCFHVETFSNIKKIIII